MNYIIANSVCCCLQCCCKELFETLYKLMGRTSFLKTMYFVIYTAFVTILLTAFIFLRDWPFFMTYIAQGIHCGDSNDFDCITASLVYRMVTSIALFIVLIILIMSLCTVRVSHILNEGLFFSKFVVITAIFIILLQFDNSVFQHISTIYNYISYLFLICQGIIIVDLGYLWGIKWAEKYSAGEDCKYAVLLVGFTAVMFGVAVAMNVAGYVVVAHEHSYAQSIGIISECSNLPNIFNTVFIVLCASVQLLNYNKQNSLLTTSFICIYISFWCFSAIYSSNKCNLSHTVSHESNQQHYEKQQFYLVGTILSIFWLLLSTFGSIYGSTNKMQDPQINSQNQVEYIQLDKAYHNNSKNTIENRKNQQTMRESSYYTGENKRNWLIWHLFMLTMVVYLSMVVTDWGSGNLITKKYSVNNNSFWSKIFIATFTFTVYIWTLIVPKIFPDRNFYFV